MSLFHSDGTSHVYAFARSGFFFQKRSIKKPVTFFKNGRKKVVSITKCNEKNCLKRIILQKNSLQVPKMVTPGKKIMVHPLQTCFALYRTKTLQLSHILTRLSDLATVIQTKENAI